MRQSIAVLLATVPCFVAPALADFPLPPTATGDLFVSSGGSNEILRFSAEGGFVAAISHPDLRHPRGLAFGPSGELFIGSQLSDRILVFSPDGTYLRQFTAPGLDGPTSLAFAPDRKLHVSSFGSDEVFVFANELFEATYTAPGLNGPNCIAFGPDGQAFVASQLDNRVYRFDAGGSPAGSFTGGGLSSPMGIALLEDRLYVTGGASDSVVVFDLDGGVVDVLPTAPAVSGPQGIAFDDHGRFVTPSFYTDTLAFYRPDGSLIRSVENAGIRTGRSVAFAPVEREPEPHVYKRPFLRGDANASGIADISDGIHILGSLFLGTPPRLECADAGDTNDDGRVDLSDSIYLFAFLFLGGKEVSPPFGECGRDLTDDELDCDGSAPCPAYESLGPFPTGMTEVVEISYTDIADLTREVRFELRAPAGAPEPLPIVLWSHGGASGRENPTTVGEEWGDVFRSAGYLVVAIAHTPRTRGDEKAGAVDERGPLCVELGITDCDMFKVLNWDRPNDVARVLDWLEAEAAGRLAGRIDVTRMAYAGHSAGGGSAMMVAGARREYGGVLTSLSDPRPVAFISCSPQGPGDDLFVEESFATIDRPHLSLTGAGDDTKGVVAENRRRAFDLMTPGDKYRGWITEESAGHGTFDHQADVCIRSTREMQHCADQLMWLDAAALAFFDAYVRGHPPARAFLDSRSLEVLSSGLLEWSRK